MPEVLTLRRKLEESRPRRDLKRGTGGLADIEFLAQFLMLSHAADHPDILRRTSGTRWRPCTAIGRFRPRFMPSFAKLMTSCARSKGACV